MAQRTGRFSSAEAEEQFRAAYAEAMADLPDPAATHDVVTDFGRVHVYRFGDQDGVPFVLLPGRSGSTTMWAPNLPAWIAERTVYAVEILGEAGLSVQERPIRNAEEQACWLAATLADLALDRAHLVGVSFGGWQAVNLALHGSGAVSSLSLIDPACVFGRFPLRLLLASLATLPVAPEFLRTRMLSWISGGVPVDDKPAARVIAASMREFELAVPQPSYPSDDQLRGLHIPTLALIGGRSEIHHPQKAYERARSLLPDGQVELWPEASHAISGEFAAAVNARVLEFVRGVEAR
jgi:pimeloyl-ACP methyl ester carboxylesterase